MSANKKKKKKIGFKKKRTWKTSEGERQKCSRKRKLTSERVRFPPCFRVSLTNQLNAQGGGKGQEGWRIFRDDKMNSCHCVTDTHMPTSPPPPTAAASTTWREVIEGKGEERKEKKERATWRSIWHFNHFLRQWWRDCRLLLLFHKSRTLIFSRQLSRRIAWYEAISHRYSPNSVCDSCAPHGQRNKKRDCLEMMTVDSTTTPRVSRMLSASSQSNKTKTKQNKKGWNSSEGEESQWIIK